MQVSASEHLALGHLSSASIQLRQCRERIGTFQKSGVNVSKLNKLSAVSAKHSVLIVWLSAVSAKRTVLSLTFSAKRLVKLEV